MQTKPLYLEDAYSKSWNAKCEEIKINGKNCQIILDQTAFYPEGGGQPSDQGRIETTNGSVQVDRVYLKQDQIIHEGKMQGEVNNGDELVCHLDWERRYKNMQVH